MIKCFLTIQASERPWGGIRKQRYLSSKCFLQMPSIYTESSPQTEISLTLSTSDKMSSNVLLAKERIKLSWNQLLTLTTLHQFQKERKIQHDDVNNVEKLIKERVMLRLWILRRSPSPLHLSRLPSLSSRHWGSKVSRGSHHWSSWITFKFWL